MKILKGAEVSAKIKEQVTQMMEGLEQGSGRAEHDPVKFTV